MTVQPTDKFGVDIAKGEIWVNLPHRGWANMSRWHTGFYMTDELPATVEPRDASQVVAKQEKQEAEH